MLYYVNLDAVFKEEAKVVLFSKNDIEGETRYFNFRTILGGSKVIPNLANYGDRMVIKVPDPNKGADEPYIPYPVVGSGATGGVDLTVVYKTLAQLGQNFTEDTAKVLEKKLSASALGPYVKLNEILYLHKLIPAFTNYQKGLDLIKVEVPELYYADTQVTLPLLREHNGKLGHQFKHITNEINKTNFMESESDLFFIQIPKYDRLKSGDFSIQSLIPRMSEVAKPYPHPIYHTPYANRVFSANQAQLRQTLRDVEDLNIELTPEQRDVVPHIEKGRVNGFSENNDLDIQPNEQEYYDALVEYIKYDIQQTHPNGDVEQLYKSLGGSEQLLFYLQSLIRNVTVMNWMHTNKYPISKVAFDFDEDDFDTEESSDDLIDPNEFLYLGEEVEDGHNILQAFIDSAAMSGMGFDAYVEAIIKLARWGSSKPSVLKLGNFDRFMDLNTLAIRHTTGNLSSMTPVTLDGYELEFQGFIMFEDKFRDTEYKNSVGFRSTKIPIPVGFACKKYYVGGTSQDVFVTVFDLISEYKNNPSAKIIKGIDFVSGRLVSTIPQSDSPLMTTLRDVYNMTRQTVDKLFVSYVSKGIKELTVEYGAKNLSNISILFDILYSSDAMTRWYESFKFSSKQELTSKMASAPMPVEQYIKVNVANVLLPTLFRASEIFEEQAQGYDTQFVLDCYLKAVADKGYQSETQFLGGPVVQVEPEVPQQLKDTEEKLEKMSSFANKTETPAPAATETVVPPATAQLEASEAIISPLQEGESVAAIVQNDKVVAGIAVRTNPATGRPLNILCSATYVPEGAPVSKSPFLGIQILVFDTLWRISTGDLKGLNVKFHNSQSIKELRDVLRP